MSDERKQKSVVFVVYKECKKADVSPPVFSLIPITYSNLSASMGSRRDALRAGYHPKNTPVAQQTPKLTKTLVMEMLMGQFITLLMISEAAMPMPMPIEPPRRLIKMDSMRNCKRMSLPRAPIAMRSPISLVRSVTENYRSPADMSAFFLFFI